MKIAKKCSYCGKQFMAQTLKTKYCSHKCNQEHYRKKARKKKKNDSEKPLIQNDEIIPYDTHLKTIKAKDLLSMKDVMVLLGISMSSVQRLIKNKHLKAAKFGARVIIRKKDLKNLITNQFENEYSEEIILNEGKKDDNNSYFSVGEISRYYNLSNRSIDRHIKKNSIEKIKKGRFVYVLKKDIIKLFGKPKNPEQ
ncbi:DNA binding domain-containing protein, excisionase family [Lutibacter agarilyticus]|uniref:DNA binding domain-containing protein, excisionase family n=1 Tax=Lutibacter agarilyticus TaxID=1109740 RepID=A0A238XGG4_9FLAO|nr:helix-turn-helix domain-containing protein [Lutibacter agarilyticus]SNR58096.1 DNA binding domain-containing protein, excisionase family [Lutibacter agarilyticus]